MLFSRSGSGQRPQLRLLACQEMKCRVGDMGIRWRAISKAGFADERIAECEGYIHRLQCIDDRNGLPSIVT